MGDAERWSSMSPIFYLASHNHWLKHPIIFLIQKHRIYISQSYCRHHNTSFSLWDPNYSLIYNFGANGRGGGENKKIKTLSPVMIYDKLRLYDKPVEDSSPQKCVYKKHLEFDSLAFRDLLSLQFNIQLEQTTLCFARGRLDAFLGA